MGKKMGLVLVPSEIKNSAKQMRTGMESSKEGYNSALQVIQGFAGNEELKSVSWDAAKNRIFEAHQAIVQGMIAAQESIEGDLDALEACVGEEELSEDDLMEKIKELEEECIRYEKRIESLRKISLCMQTVKLDSLALVIEMYRSLLKKTKEELEIIRKKLQYLYETANSSYALFQNVGALLGAVECAINDAEVYISGTGKLSDGTWKITIYETIKKIEDAKNCEWLPPVMQIDGLTEQEIYLKECIEKLNDREQTIKWNQEKINKVWEECSAYYEKTGVQVDPRLMMAIIYCEGTGSFNTSSKNRAADGGNGPNSDFSNDVELAVDLLGGKVMAYAYYQKDFSKAREAAYKEKLEGIKDYDDILHYLNWETPRVSFNENNMQIGVYAEGPNWNRQVRDVYSNLAYDEAPHDYTEYARSLGSGKLIEITKKYGMDIKSVEFIAKEGDGVFTIVGVDKVDKDEK